MLCATYLRKSNKTFLCQTKRGKAVHSLCGRELKRDGEGSGEGERRTQSESRSRTFVSLRGGERRRKPSVQGRERALALGGLLGEQKAGSKAMEAQMEGNFCPLKNDFLIYFFLFSLFCLWVERTRRPGPRSRGRPGGLASSLSAASSTCSKRQVCAREFWDRQLTENHVYAGQEMPNWGFPVLTSYLRSHHPKRGRISTWHRVLQQ